MNSLVKELIQPLLEASDRLVALYPGKFKPPHKGHFDVVKGLLNKADEVVVVVSPLPKDGITAQQSEAAWNLYKTILGDKVTVVVAPSSPVSYVYDIIKNNPEDNFIVAYGKGEESRYKSLTKNPKIQIIDGGTVSDEGGNINATDFRNALKTNQDISRFLPGGIDQQDFIKAISKGTIEEDCGCQHEQPMDFKSALASLTKYMIDQGMNIKPLPRLKIINSDIQNANDILGKTAYYDPTNCSITLYTLNRHPKDILRSYAHEMIHRIQDNEGRLNGIGTTNTNEDSNLQELEKEAYLNGNITFRNWEDSIKNQNYIKEYKQYVLKELFEKDLPNIKKISNTNYIVGNEKDIEAEYYFRPASLDPNDWEIHWKFTENNKNTSPEAWKQITATSYKILKDFIDNNNPNLIEISGNTSAKTNIYKSKSYLEKLENIFNNQYEIDNSNDYVIYLKKIEKIAESGIKKRMKTLNESYEQALNYWQNGDINSKSKIERWNSIKRKVKREVLKELYNIK